MGSPPFDFTEAKPADSDIVSQHPNDERDMRDNIDSWTDFEHGSASGRHKIPKGTVAARDAITDWEAGSLWINTDTSPDTLMMNTGTKATPVWVSVNVSATAFGLSLIDDANAAAARTTLGLGDAAVADLLDEDNMTSNSATDAASQQSIKAYVDAVPVLIPRGHIDGLTLANYVTDADHDINVAAGEAVDGAQAAVIVLSSTLRKRIDAGWSVGSGNGGLDTGTVAADTWYHMWLIERSDTEVTDALFSLSATAPSMPGSYDRKRRIGAVLTDGSANIIAFFQDADHFYWDIPVQDYDDGNPGTTAVTRTLTVPTGLVVKALHHFKGITASVGNAFYGLATSLDQTNSVPSATKNHVDCPSGNYIDGASLRIRTNTSGQIRTRVSNTASVITVYGTTEGWIDPRGRNA